MLFILQLLKIHKYTFKISSTEGTCTLEAFILAHKTTYDIFKKVFFVSPTGKITLFFSMHATTAYSLSISLFFHLRCTQRHLLWKKS